jgi:hypothetical protein
VLHSADYVLTGRLAEGIDKDSWLRSSKPKRLEVGGLAAIVGMRSVQQAISDLAAINDGGINIR